jgi:hypothetical protein
LIVQLDADEFIHPRFVEEIIKIVNESELKESLAFSSEWLQMYETNSRYRTDGVWKNNYKAFAFIDQRDVDYNRSYITNEHISRIPDIKKLYKLTTPILHVQYLAKKRCELKQAVYMCTERMKGIDPRKTNNRYSITKFKENTPTEELEESLYKDMELPGAQEYSTIDSTKLDAILTMFDSKGSLFFEPLEVWHIDELRERFVLDNGRQPLNIRVFPKWIILLNDMRNKLKYKLIYRV